MAVQIAKAGTPTLELTARHPIRHLIPILVLDLDLPEEIPVAVLAVRNVPCLPENIE